MEKATAQKPRQPVVYRMDNDQCVWSRAGVVKPIKCMNAFDCLDCSFDKKLISDYEAKETAAGGTSLCEAPPRLRILMKHMKCRHMFSGRIPYKLCAHSYNCVKCPYDQMLEDTAVVPQLTSPSLDFVSGFAVAKDYYHHRYHSWARVEYGGRVRVGIDDFAARLMGPQDQIRLPKIGSRVSRNQPIATLARNGNEAETLSPVDGWVSAINPKLTSRTETVNDMPYADGWLMIIQPTKLRNNLKNLFYGNESVAWIDEEAGRLFDLISEETGHRLAVTGGEAVKDIYGAVPEIGWDRLVNSFLK